MTDPVQQPRFTIPVRKEHILLALVIVVFGAGMVSGSALPGVGGLIGAGIIALGIFYVYSQYHKQKRLAAKAGQAPAPS